MQGLWSCHHWEVPGKRPNPHIRPVRQRIPASPEQVASFCAALDKLEVWESRDDYHPQDLSADVWDGTVWSFKASLARKTCDCGGSNGHPSMPIRGRRRSIPAAMGC